MRNRFLTFVTVAIILSACQTLPSPEIPTPSNISKESIVPTTKAPGTATPTPAIPTNTATIQATNTLGPPTETPTPAPVIDADGNITWHPQQVLIRSEESGGDGNGYDYPPEFVLLWDGTLLQPGKNTDGAPYISHLNQEEICKLLNTIDKTGYFEEPNYYNFPFDGLGGQYITVNGWKSNTSGAQVLWYALSGAPYYDGLFCRNCPVPSGETIIKPGLANTYFLLENYLSSNRKVAPVDKLLVTIIPEEEPNSSWPIKSITTAELIKKCDETSCYDVGMVVEGDVAKEIREKIGNAEIFSDESTPYMSAFRIMYRPVWPFEPENWYSDPKMSAWEDIPKDFTMTCNPEMGRYSILPLDPKSNLWYYSPDGKWGAEVVNNPDKSNQIRVVNTAGYEKFYEYLPEQFGQSAIKVYPRYWTRDGRFFLTNILNGNFDFMKTPFINSLGLQRISIPDGKADYIFQGTEGESFAYIISDENGKVAFIRQGENPVKITVKDISSLQEVTSPLILPEGISTSYTNAGTMAVSPDGKSLFIAANYAENGKLNGVIIKVDKFNPSNQTIVYQDDTPFKLVQTTFRDYYAEICPLDADYESYCPIRIDLETGKIDQ